MHGYAVSNLSSRDRFNWTPDETDEMIRFVEEKQLHSPTQVKKVDLDDLLEDLGLGYSVYRDVQNNAGVMVMDIAIKKVRDKLQKLVKQGTTVNRGFKDNEMDVAQSDTETTSATAPNQSSKSVTPVAGTSLRSKATSGVMSGGIHALDIAQKSQEIP